MTTSPTFRFTTRSGYNLAQCPLYIRERLVTLFPPTLLDKETVRSRVIALQWATPLAKRYV